MTAPHAVSVQAVSKRFRGRPTTARAAAALLTSASWRAWPLRRARAVDPERDASWALQDVSFEVAEGDIVGVVGNNGAGKSVLLRILARVTRPTTGRVEVRGRVAPLLGVGTGFHPELTGRENLYLNGVILGMRRAEVHRRVDDIVAFSELGGVLDVPIKQYSTGMRMRLAFSVAAHLDRDIFLLDEVFAVGDVAFQGRCEARVRELAREGKTILLVSHGKQAVQQVCTRALLLDHGRLVASGTPVDIATRYDRLRREASDARP